MPFPGKREILLPHTTPTHIPEVHVTDFWEFRGGAKNYENLSPQAVFLQPKASRFLSCISFPFAQASLPVLSIHSFQRKQRRQTEGDFSYTLASLILVVVVTTTDRPASPPTTIVAKTMHSQLS